MGDGAAKKAGRLTTFGMRLHISTLRASLESLEFRIKELLSIENDLDVMNGRIDGNRAAALGMETATSNHIRQVSALVELNNAMKRRGGPAAEDRRANYSACVESAIQGIADIWRVLKTMDGVFEEITRTTGNNAVLLKKEEKKAQRHYKLLVKEEAVLKTIEEKEMLVDDGARAEFRECLKAVRKRGDASTDIKIRVMAKATRSRALQAEANDAMDGLKRKQLVLYNLLLELGADAGGLRGRVRRVWRGLWGAGSGASTKQ